MNVEEIMAASDAWAVAQAQTHEWAMPTNKETKGQQSICQIRSEMETFLTALNNLGILGGKACEIGMGLGGTHVVFRQCFAFVATVEPDIGAIEQFKQKTPVLPNVGTFHRGMSNNSDVIEAVRLEAPYDMIFVDGEHSYEGVTEDYNNYYPLVKSGGVIAFHDSKGDDRVTAFINDLEAGKIGGMEHVVGRIEHGQVAGISFVVKE